MHHWLETLEGIVEKNSLWKAVRQEKQVTKELKCAFSLDFRKFHQKGVTGRICMSSSLWGGSAVEGAISETGVKKTDHRPACDLKETDIVPRPCHRRFQ